MLYASFESGKSVPIAGKNRLIKSTAVIVWLTAFALVATAATFVIRYDTTSNELLSRKQSQDDLNSYFNDLDSSDADSKEASHHSWGGMDAQTRSYIDNKRKALRHGGGFTTFDKSGHAVPIRKVWSASAAAARLESASLVSSKVSHLAKSTVKSSYEPHSVAELAKMRAAAESQYQLHRAHTKVILPHSNLEIYSRLQSYVQFFA